MNKTKKSFPVRLQQAVNYWQLYTKPMRECRKKMLSQYANGWYSGASLASRVSQPINLLDRGVQIIAPYLVSQNPDVMIEVRSGLGNPNVKAFADTLRLALLHLFGEIKLSEYTLRPVVIDSLFAMGITKTAAMHSHTVEINGYLHDIGQPYCDRIDFDDYIGDIAARNRQEMKFEGHKYRLPEEYVKTSGLFKNYDGLNPDISLYGSTNPETVGKPNFQQYQELHPTIQLMDLWIPQDGVILTLPLLGHGSKIMRTVEWEGPEEGPFDILAYRYFPNSVIPIPPVYTWLDINRAVNNIVTNMRNQVSREKTIGLYNLGADDEVDRIKDAAPGEMIGVSNVDSVKELKLGGFNSESFPFLQFLLAEYSKTGPNLDITGGRGSAANTLGQEQILLSNAQRELDDMVNEAYRFTSSITKKLAWQLWSDPLVMVPLVKRIAGVDLEVEYSESVKEGDFLDYTFNIEPYSMGRMNPEIKYQKLMQLISQLALPLAQIAASQGTVIDAAQLVKDAAKFLGTNTDNWWKSAIPSNTGLNPYQPEQGTPKAKSGQADGRLGKTGALGASSRNANLIQQQTRAPQKSSKEI